MLIAVWMGFDSVSDLTVKWRWNTFTQTYQEKQFDQLGCTLDRFHFPRVAMFEKSTYLRSKMDLAGIQRYKYMKKWIWPLETHTLVPRFKEPQVLASCLTLQDPKVDQQGWKLQVPLLPCLVLETTIMVHMIPNENVLLVLLCINTLTIHISNF